MMTPESLDSVRRSRRSAAEILLSGLLTAVVGSVIINVVGLLAMQAADELCEQGFPGNTYLSDPDGWRCDLDFGAAMLAGVFFTIPGLPFGFALAWLWQRRRRRPVSAVSEYANVIGIGLAVLAGMVGALPLLALLFFVYVGFGLFGYLVQAVVAITVAGLIVWDCRRGARAASP